jgi:polyisoprenoid-binding protein YceI
MKRIIIGILSIVLLTTFDAGAQTFNLNPTNTTIKFKVRNMAIMHVEGTFDKFSGNAEVDEADLSRSKIEVSIDTASINTGITRRDKHLRSADFFDVERFPAMKFVATSVEKEGAGKLKLTGKLTIKEVTKPVVLAVDGPAADTGTATATATINRKDFGVSWGAVIGDEVQITIVTQLKKP